MTDRPTKPSVEEIARLIHGAEFVNWRCHGECREAAEEILRRYEVSAR